MNKFARLQGIKFYVVIYPLFYKDRLGRYPFNDIHRRLMDACAEQGITCFDAYQPFKKYYSLKRFIVHPVDYHPNGLANRVIVDYLAGRPEFTFE